MSIPSTFDTNSKVWLRDRTHASVTPLRSDSRSAERSGTTTSRPRLGEAVHHSQYGDGQVLAHWPDGTLLVRFHSTAKSRLVWPSFLDIVNGQQR